MEVIFELFDDLGDIIAKELPLHIVDNIGIYAITFGKIIEITSEHDFLYRGKISIPRLTFERYTDRQNEHMLYTILVSEFVEMTGKDKYSEKLQVFKGRFIVYFRKSLWVNSNIRYYCGTQFIQETDYIKHEKYMEPIPEKFRSLN